MSVVSKAVNVSDPADKVGQSLVELVKAVKLALADGWDVSADAPVLVLAAVKNLAPLVQNLGGAVEDLKAERAASLRALLLALSDLAEELLPK